MGIFLSRNEAEAYVVDDDGGGGGGDD